MVDPDFIHQDFERRLREIPTQGMGLSVDVYTPDLFELVSRLREQGLQPGYLEVFKATTTALTRVRQAMGYPARLPRRRLVDHSAGRASVSVLSAGYRRDRRATQ